MQMTLGELIKALKQEDAASRVQFDFCDFVPGKLGSYRGYYDQLAFDYSPDGDMTVGELLAHCKETVGKTFTGWKGGEYLMDEQTELWVAQPGRSSGTAVADVRGGWPVVLVTEYQD